MANPGHLQILRHGVKIWNRWRQEHPDIQPDLIWADLRRETLGGLELTGVNLSQALLRGAVLWGADLRGADLSDADLSEATLREADLGWANLSGANLRRANVSGADFYRANLTGAIVPDDVRRRSIELDDNVLWKGGENAMQVMRQEGQGLVEYALILVLVAIVVIAILLLLGPVVGNVFSQVVSNL
jgi:Flp pilus assembly pilin Flp